MEEEKRQRAVPKFGSFKPKPAAEPNPDRAASKERETRVRRGDDRGGAEDPRSDRRLHDREREREHRHSGRDVGRERHRDRERERATGRERTKERDREKDRDQKQKRESGRVGDRDRERDRESGRERGKDWDKGRDREWERERTRREHHSTRPGSPRTAKAASHQGRNERKDFGTSAPVNDLFTIDKRGDPLILQYGTNDRSKIPAYYRAGSGRIIGAPGFLTIHRDGPNEQFSISHRRGGAGGVPALRDKALVTAANRLKSRRIKPSTSTDQHPPSASDDFIPLLPSRKRKRGDDHPTTSSSEPESQDYRSIHGKALSEDSDSDSDSDSSASSSSSTPPSPSQTLPSPSKAAATLAATLTTHLKTHPSDTQAWLQLIHLQPLLFHPSNHSHPHSSLTQDETKALSALKLSLYEEALPHASTQSDRLAVAAWQGVLEMVFCRPAGFGEGLESAMGSFADFWESEVPRMGEEWARGWRHFVEEEDGMGEPPEGKGDRPGDAPRSSDPFKAWAALEQLGAEKARMPARTLDEGTEDDPFRVVMFSDIKDLLVWFPSAVLPRVRPLLLDGFLVFCGLPPACLSGDAFAALLSDPFVACQGQGLKLALTRSDDGLNVDLSRRPPEFRQQGGSMAVSQDILFSGDTWFRYLDKWSSAFQPGDRQVDASWVLGVLGYAVKTCGMEELAEYYLAMEWLNEPTRARKIAKSLLKQYSSNIKLYSAYALIECANQNAEVSNKVLSSATGLALSSTSSASQLLWNTWAWIHLESGQQQMALVRLCSSVEKGFEGSTVSPALLLKAKSHFSSTRDYSLSSLQLENAAQFAESLMLLEYLVAEGGSEPSSETQGNITAAISSIDHFSQELESRNLSKSPHHERLLQTTARLLYYHATHGPYRPTYLRAQLHTLLTYFPHNTLLLELLAWANPPLRINDPVRALLQQTLSLAGPNNSTNNTSLLSTHRFAIAHEAHAGTAHSVRAAFEAALASSEACGKSVELWVWYLQFCCSRRDEFRGGKVAKEVFYRAVNACPWAKEVYMEAFGGLLAAGDFSAGELRGVFDMMVAKGVRVHVDLEDFLKGRRG